MSKLKLAVQKKGRLHDASIDLLKRCGIQIPNGGQKLIAECKNFPLEILFLRDDDIPQYVEEGIVDIGIVGTNLFLETEKEVQKIADLGFAQCKLCIAIPKDQGTFKLADLNSKRIATSYPNILSKYLASQNIKAKIEYLSGSVEIATSMGLADAICDIVSSGSTLLANGLKEVVTVLNSEAILIANNDLKAEQQELLYQLLFRINAVKEAEQSKYILLNCKNENLPQIIKILPGVNSPTILPLALSGWSSLHSVISEYRFWEIIDELKSNGAEGILVIPIEKMIL